MGGIKIEQKGLFQEITNVPKLTNKNILRGGKIKSKSHNMAIVSELEKNIVNVKKN